MMESLTYWAVAMVGAVAIAALADMLTPDGDMKKYVNLVIGIVLMMIIIGPIMKLKSLHIHEMPQLYQATDEEYFEQIFEENLRKGVGRSGEVHAAP